MKHRIVPITVSLAFAAVALLGGTQKASAQLPYSITIVKKDVAFSFVKYETYRIALHEFHMTIKNTSPNPVVVTVARTKNQLPDLNWTSAMCTGEQCYSPEEDTPPSFTLPVGGSEYVRLVITVLDSTVIGSKGEFALRFSSDMGGAFEEITLGATLTEAQAGVDQKTIILEAAYPNPTRSIVTIPLSEELSAARSIGLEIVDERGAVAGDFSEAARAAMGVSTEISIDLSALPSGRYFYRLTADATVATGTIVVRR